MSDQEEYIDMVPTKKEKERTPKLKCLITGKVRATNREFLELKATRTTGSIEKYIEHYISRQALYLLKQGKTVEEIRIMLKSTETNTISSEKMIEAIKINGKPLPINNNNLCP